MIFFCNELKEDWSTAFKGYSKVALNSRLGIHRALWKHSQKTGDKSLGAELKSMKVPELIEIEER